MRCLVVIAIVYGLGLVGALGWHISYGPPFDQTTFALLLVFAVSTALVGLVSLWGAIGMLHWAKRAVGFICGVTAVVGLWLLFFDWNRFLIFQLLVVLSVQMGVLLVALGGLRFLGALSLTSASGEAARHRGRRLSVFDLLMLTAALAMFCAVVRTARPVQLSWALYVLLLAGACARR